MKKKGIFVTGTDTNVGKTWVGQALIRQLVQQGVDVAPRKPIESGWICIEETDAYALANAANKLNQLDEVCSKRYASALSPVSAAKLEGKQHTLEEGVIDCNQGVEKDSFLYVEGAGGFYSPLYHNGLNADFAQQLQLPILLVAEDKLGCINHILLTVEAIRRKNLTLLAIVLNQARPKSNSNMDNLCELKELTDSPIVFMDYNQQECPKSLFLLVG